ncbi:YbaB/EbfC family nucleoid-associated protein [Kitasatospora sp. NPDC057223]|jgi:DNA-binding protein YbaB|uniref:YbaB/EbfC family nucleoid-associated protein n=1 Tax=Kitasatospora sp. NPDC057223 TaxID=3346055 RepID=UPI00362A2759
MSFSFAEQLESVMAEMMEQQARMLAAQQELQAATASAMSKDRMVTAKVGPQGEVVSLTFHTSDYRTMAPAQLATVLTDVLNEARARMGEQVMKSMSAFEGVGDLLRESLTGPTDLDEVLAPLIAMRPQRGEGLKPARTKQEDFNG